MNFGPVTPEITTVTNAPVWMRRQKSAYPTKYLGNSLTDVYQIFSIGRHVYEDYTSGSAMAEGPRDSLSVEIL